MWCRLFPDEIRSAGVVCVYQVYTMIWFDSRRHAHLQVGRDEDISSEIIKPYTYIQSESSEFFSFSYLVLRIRTVFGFGGFKE